MDTTLKLKCSCGYEEIEFYKDPECNNLEISIWRRGHSLPMPMLERIRWAWHCLRKGLLWADEIILTEGQSKKIVEFLNKKESKSLSPANQTEDNKIFVVGLLFKDREIYLKQMGDQWEPVVCGISTFSQDDDILSKLVREIELETKLNKTTQLEPYSRFDLLPTGSKSVICYAMYLRPGEIIENETFTWKKFPKSMLGKLNIDPSVRECIEIAYQGWEMQK